MSIAKRLEKLENTVQEHLQESGAIRSDLRWLKKSMYGVYGLGATILVTIVGALVAHVLL